MPDASSDITVEAEAPDATTDPVTNTTRILYETNLSHAAIATETIKSLWPMRFVEARLAAGQPLDESQTNSFNILANTLLSIHAQEYAVELPELYAFWLTVVKRMDEAQSSGLYHPPENLRVMIDAVRVKTQLDAAREAAPWIAGPASIVIDPALHPIAIPAGLRFLSSKDRLALLEHQSVIRQQAAKKFPFELSLAPRDHGHPEAWITPLDDSWSASIVVAATGHISLEDELSPADELLQTRRRRMSPLADLDWKSSENEGFSPSSVHWLLPPAKNPAAGSIHWALTDGKTARPTGILFTHAVLGRTRQVFVFSNDLTVAAHFSRSPRRPAGTSREQFTPGYRLARFRDQLEPVLASLRFVSGEQRHDACPDDPRSPASLETLITGAPSRMERAVSRMIAEQDRKSSFWRFLRDNPHHLALAAILLTPVFAALWRRRTENNPP